MAGTCLIRIVFHHSDYNPFHFPTSSAPTYFFGSWVAQSDLHFKYELTLDRYTKSTVLTDRLIVLLRYILCIHIRFRICDETKKLHVTVCKALESYNVDAYKCVRGERRKLNVFRLPILKKVERGAP